MTAGTAVRSSTQRGRIPAPRAAPARELRMVEPVRIIAAEAASRPAERGDETPQLRLERRLLDGSCYRIIMLVCAGPGPRDQDRPPHRLELLQEIIPVGEPDGVGRVS